MILEKMKNIIIVISFLVFTVSVNAQNINFDSIQINENISLLIDFDELVKLNLIDSIVPIPELMDMSTADSLIYVGSTYFEYYKKENYCRINVIKFDKKIKTVTINKTRLNQFTTFQDIKKMFPIDCPTKHSVSIYGDSSEYFTCGVWLKTTQGTLLDVKLVFYFIENKLVRLDLWEPS